MKNKLIIGRYLPNNSVIHRLDPRAKLIFVFVFIIFIFFAHSFATFAWVILLILCFINTDIFLLNLYVCNAHLFYSRRDYAIRNRFY